MSERGKKLKADFIASRGFWVDEYEELATLCPDFLEAHLAASVIMTKSELLSPLLSELIAIAIDVSTTHLFESGLRLHIRNALRIGATPEQITTVIQMVSGIGIQSQFVGVPLLQQILADKREGFIDLSRPLTTREQELKDSIVALTGVWSDAHTHVLLTSPDYLDAYANVAGVSLKNSCLSAKEKALIMVAVNGAVTHLEEAGLRLAMEAAIAAGATPQEIVHVLRRVSSLGMHSCMFGFPILFSEIARVEKEARASADEDGLLHRPLPEEIQ
jgi:alkylhydroperoxidase/carboxymuconolactone decarboxylase family protein YurZ